jgi:5-methylcytosine-specific restriction endonuclease McrA
MDKIKAKKRALRLLKGQTYNEFRYQEIKGWVLDGLGGCCIECGTKDYLEIHHIIEVEERDRPMAWRIRDWENGLEQDNLLCLCKTCHDYLTKNPQHKAVVGMEKETELINKMEDREGEGYLRIKTDEERYGKD